MKRIIYFSWLFIVTITSLETKSQQTNSSLAIEWLRYISADEQKGRFPGTAEHLRLGDSIAHYFEKLGIQKHPLVQSYHQPIKLDLSFLKTTSYNIIGWIPGTEKPEDYIFITAHYDHLGTSTSNPTPRFNQKEVISRDTIFNGANDNGTGTAAVLTLAEYFSKYPPKKSIVFICFTAEELGLIGSWPIAYLFKDHHIEAVLNIEMIGRTLNKKNTHPFLTGYEYSNLGDLLNKGLEIYDSNKYGSKHIAKDPFYTHKLFMRSDNYSFAKVGIPAHTILTSSPVDKYYHKLKDEYNTIDLNHFTTTIETIKNALMYIVNDAPAPSRINILKLPTN